MHVFLLAAYGTFLTLPALISGFIPSADGPTHLIMSRQFADQFWAGEFYPRWMVGMNAGLGSPLFFIFGPIPYYITALFRPFFSNDPEGWLQLGVAASLAITSSGFSAYLWLKQETNRSTALISAILYMSMPYHLAYTLYQRFGFAELWAFALLPMIMLQVGDVVRGKRTAMVWLAIFYALLVMTHLPTTLTFSVIPPAYALFIANTGERMRAGGRVTSALALGVGLSAIYLLPVITSQKYVCYDELKTGYFFYGNNFLFYGPRFSTQAQHIVDYLSTTTAVMALIALCAWQGIRISPDKLLVHYGLFWALVAIIALIMMVPLSTPVWVAIPALQALQFPWRFNTVLTLALTALVALWISSLPRPSKIGRAVLPLIACILIIGQSLPYVIQNLAMARAVGVPSVDRLLQLFSDHSGSVHIGLESQKISRDIPENRPKWANRELFEFDLDSVKAMAALGGTLNKARLGEGSGNVSILRWEPRNILLGVSTPVEAALTVNQFYFPGWTARMKGQMATLPLQPSNPEGLIQIRIPPGNHAIEVVLEATWSEGAGKVISGLTALFVAFLAFRYRHGFHKTRSQPNGYTSI